MRYAAGVFGVVIALAWCLIVGTNVAAADWGGGIDYKSSSVFYSLGKTCYGYFQYLPVIDLPDRQDMCVKDGETFRFGTYFSGSTPPRAAIAYPYDSEFHRVYGVCEALWGCQYAPEGDRLVELRQLGGRYPHAVVYDNVSQRIKRVFDSTLEFHYEFDATSPEYMIGGSGGLVLGIGAVALSTNGRWLLAELRDLGIALIDLDQKTTKRIVAPGFRYGRGFDPVEQLAISNDGRTAAVMGENVGLTVTRVMDDCGESLGEFIPETFPFGVIPCPQLDIDASQFSTHFRMALSPKFNQESTELTFVALSYDQGPRTVSIRPVGHRPNTDLSYIALGDSFTSGEGETDDRYYLPGTNDPFEKCHTSRRSYPFLVGDAFLLPATKVRNVACAGAKMHDIVGSDHAYTGQGQRLGTRGQNLSDNEISQKQVQALESFLPGRVLQEMFISQYRPSIVTIGVGGNDAGIMDKLRACAMPDSCEWIDEDRRLAVGLEIQRLYDRLVATYRRLHASSPHSKFYAVGYPRAIVVDGFCTPLVGTLFNREERLFMVNFIDYLNQVIEAAAHRAGISFIDTTESFAGHELCSGSLQSAMNGVRVGDDATLLTSLPMLKIIGGESFHPSPYGHQLIGATITRDHQDLMTRPACLELSCLNNEMPPMLSEYWLGSAVASPLLRAENLIPSASVVFDVPASINLPPGSLAPDSPVRLEVHSPIQIIGDFITRSDGSFAASFATNRGISEGFHTIHLYGSTYSGQPLDIYQTVALGEPDSFNSMRNVDEVATDHRGQHTITSQLTSLQTPRDTAVLGAMTGPAGSRKPSIRYDFLPLALLVLVLTCLTAVAAWLIFRRRNSTHDRGG